MTDETSTTSNDDDPLDADAGRRDAVLADLTELDPGDEQAATELAQEYGVDPNVLRAVYDIVQVEATWEGPLPPPNVLAGYEQVMPGAADRVFRLTEGQAAHRQALERRIVETHSLIERRGQLLAFVLMLAALVIGGLLISDGKDAVGIAVVFGTLAGIGGTFVYSRRQQRAELQARAEEMEDSEPPRLESNAAE